MTKKSLEDLLQSYKDVRRDFLSTGSFVLDETISNGLGCPTKVTIELHSPSGYGKSTIAAHWAKYLYQTYGKKTLYLDVEKGGLSDSLKESMGITEDMIDHLYVDFYEDVEEIIESASLSKDREYGLVVIDSITTLAPKRLMEASVTDMMSMVGIKARLDAWLLMKLKSLVVKKDWVFLLINQMRTDIDMTGRRPPALKAAGGEALKFVADITLELGQLAKKEMDILDENGAVIGKCCSIQALKNRWNKPLQKRNIYIMFGQGISNVRSAIDILMDLGMIKQSGSYFIINCGDLQKNVQGRVGLVDFIKDNFDKIKPFLSRMIENGQS